MPPYDEEDNEEESHDGWDGLDEDEAEWEDDDESEWDDDEDDDEDDEDE